MLTTEGTATLAAAWNGVELSVHDWLKGLHQRGRLLPLLGEAVVAEFVTAQARAAGLTVSAEELQAAADAFRRRAGLASAERTSAWLAGQRLAVVDLEDALERELLVAKFKDHLTCDRVAAHFAAHAADYASARLRLIVVAREDLARELLSQVREEGRDFADLAREHSQHPSRPAGGDAGTVLRRHLPRQLGDAVFAARAGAVVGPLPSPQGFQLTLVEATAPAELNEELAALIRQELFDAWLREQLARQQPVFPLLEAL
jgi:putative peptide maturation system protein